MEKIDVEETIEETKQTDFESKEKEFMAKLQGCSKDHAKEIDLYGKSYDDKLAQIREMMD